MKKKILFVINTLGQAGAEKALLNLISALDRNAYEIYLYVMLNQGEMIYDVPNYVHVLNKHISPLPVLGKEGEGHMTKEVLKSFVRHGSGIKYASYFLKNYNRMKQSKRILWDKLLWREVACGAKRFSTEFDLAVAYLEGASTYYVADYVNAKKKAAWIHVDMEQAGYTKELDLDCYEKMDACFTVSEEVEHAFFRIHPECREKTKVFENILDTKRMEKLSHQGEAKEFDKNSFCILTVGRLHPQKGYELAVETMEELKKKNYPIKWYIMGEGPLRKKLEELICEKGLKEEMILLGAKKNPYPYFLDCDLYVHATRFEGKSIALSEAKALGAPLVVSNVSGNRQQVKDGENGLICALSKEELSRSIIRLYEDEALRKKMGDTNKSQSVFGGKEDLSLLLDLVKDE